MTGKSLIEKLETSKAKVDSQPDLAEMFSIKAAKLAYDACISIVRRHYEGRPAVSGKPLEMQSRDELLNLLRSIRLCENYQAGDEIKSTDAEIIASKIAHKRQPEQPQDQVERVAKILKRHFWESVNGVSWTKLAIDMISALGDGSATIAPVSAETVQPITPANYEPGIVGIGNERLRQDKLREISLVEGRLENLMCRAFQENNGQATIISQIIREMKEYGYLRTTEPMSISLEDAKRAYLSGRSTSGAENMNLLNSTQREDVRHEGGIAAILDAAGLTYVD